MSHRFDRFFIDLYAAAYGAARGETLNGGGILYTIPVKSVLFTHKSHWD